MLIRLPYRWICVLIFFVATCSCHISLGFWFFSCPHGNGQGRVGDVCSAFCRCHPLNTCEAGVQKCARPGEYGERCHVAKPCGSGLTCQPGVQKCFHVPRRHGEPCVAGYECGAGLSCEPGVQRCYHHPRLYNEPCSAGFSCSSGLSCQPGYQRCLHHPRLENERCSAGYSCADGLVCRLCDKPFATCQLGRVPALTEQDYGRPFNKVAFLVTHNSFSNSPSFAVWVRNQRFSVRQQLEDGVRGLMLDIYPGWGEADVRLCHASCFWGGSTNLLDTLIEIRKFLESNEREVITIVFEDYLRNPVILKRVFDQAGLSSHVLRKENWGDGFNDWPTLTDMRRLGRLVVFNNNGLNGFPYTEFNMWHYVRENRYGNAGLNKKECIDRPESRWNKAWNDHWSLVLINWFSTAANPLQPCLNSFAEIKNKLTTCYDKFGFWANFVAVDFYTAGSGGGAFQAVKWLNKKFREGGASADRKKASPLPFPRSHIVSHSQTNKSSLLETRTKNPADEPGYGSGFHDLSDIIAHILLNKNRWFTKKSNVSKTLTDIMSADGSYLNSSRVSDAVSSQSHKRKDWATRKNNAGNKEKIFPANIVTSTYSNIQSSENYGSKRTALVIDNDVDSRNWNSTPRSNHTNHKQNTQDFLSKVHPYLKNDQSNHPFSGTTDKTGNIPRVRPRNLTSQGEVFHVGPQGKVARLANFTGRHSRFPPSALRSKKNMAVKLRNLRRQLARLKLKLNKYIHSAHIGTKKKVKNNTLNILGKVRKAPLNFSSS